MPVASWNLSRVGWLPLSSSSRYSDQFAQVSVGSFFELSVAGEGLSSPALEQAARVSAAAPIPAPCSIVRLLTCARRACTTRLRMSGSSGRDRDICGFSFTGARVRRRCRGLILAQLGPRHDRHGQKRPFRNIDFTKSAQVGGYLLRIPPYSPVT